MPNRAAAGGLSERRYMLKTIAVIVLVIWASDVAAQSRIEAEQIERGGPNVPIVWVVFTGINSASLASQGAELLTSTALDGVVGAGDDKAIITFWKPTQEPYIWASLVRCIDYFDSFMQNTGSACSIPRSQER